MSVLKKKGLNSLKKKVKRGFRGYPAATIAFYGPTATLATKVVVGIAKGPGSEINLLRKWISTDEDIRADEDVGREVLAFIKEQGVLSIAMPDRLIGCPHEEGIDYPDGSSCPQCPFWAGRDRFTHERIQ